MLLLWRLKPHLVRNPTVQIFLRPCCAPHSLLKQDYLKTSFYYCVFPPSVSVFCPFLFIFSAYTHTHTHPILQNYHVMFNVTNKFCLILSCRSAAMAKGCITVTKYFLFLFNLLFFVSNLIYLSFLDGWWCRSIACTVKILSHDSTFCRLIDR